MPVQEIDSSAPDLDALLREQIAYYRERASEYDEWFLRRGRYDLGPERNRRWFEQVETVRECLDERLAEAAEDARVLELACGTGLWTELLVAHGARVTAVDAAPEVIALNRARLEALGRLDQVEYQQADLFAWQPSARYDLVFFGFWLTHVPRERFDEFWRRVGDALAPGGRVFFVDNRFPPTPGAKHNQTVAADGTRAVRRLNDGREFEIVKIFYEPAVLEARLAGLGFAFDVRATDEYFIYGFGARA